ncbi:MAG: hypothetical protein P1V36_17415 [Planctomycetota bacterium]|nr:hypothetical protein [Planctomycetota bacterium]
MQSSRLSTCLALAVVMAMAAGCSSGPSVGGLFGDDCNTCAAPAPVAQTPCDPPPVACDPCAAPVVAQQDGVRPPDARPGEVWCYVRVPAVTRQVEERICVREECSRQIPVPAVTKQVARQVCVRPASTRQIPIPAEFKDVCEQVQTCGPKTEWQKVNCNPSQLAPKEQVGECWTLVETPAQFTTRTKRVCVREASCRVEQIPAEFETQYETVCVTPACTRTEVTPAQYETRFREEVVCGPRWEWRRTTECEVPGEAPMGAAPMNQAPVGLAPLDPAPIEQAPVGNGVGNPDANLPPAGALPPLR